MSTESYHRNSACRVTVYRLVAEMPPTSGVITTPDVLIVKLVPDLTTIAVIGRICVYVLAVILILFILQEVVGVGITF